MSISQDVSKFSSVCPIIIAQFQEKFILLGKTLLLMCQSGLIILQVKEDEGKAWEKRIHSPSTTRGLTASGLLQTHPMPVTVAREVPCALPIQSPPLNLSYGW